MWKLELTVQDFHTAPGSGPGTPATLAVTPAVDERLATVATVTATLAPVVPSALVAAAPGVLGTPTARATRARRTPTLLWALEQPREVLVRDRYAARPGRARRRDVLVAGSGPHELRVDARLGELALHGAALVR